MLFFYRLVLFLYFAKVAHVVLLHATTSFNSIPALGAMDYYSIRCISIVQVPSYNWLITNGINRQQAEELQLKLVLSILTPSPILRLPRE